MPLHMHERPRKGAKQVPLTDPERDARIQLAGCYRIFHMLGWTELIFNHITLRVPGPQRIFLINPFGLHYSEVTASNLVAIDIDGTPVRETAHPINRAGFVTHRRHTRPSRWRALCDAHAHDHGHGGRMLEGRPFA